MKSAAILMLSVFAAASARATAGNGFAPYPLERYASITNRMPFGPLPAGFVEGLGAGAEGAEAETAKLPEEIIAEQQELAKQVKMACLNIAPGGVKMVGFVDSAENPPVTYYMAVGDERKGWAVLDADFDKEWAQIAKDGVIVTMKLGEGLIDAPPGSIGAISNGVAGVSSAKATTANTPTIVRPPSTQAARELVGIAKAPVATSKIQPASAPSSFRERLQTRDNLRKQAEEAKQKAELKRLTEVARQAAQEEIEKQRLEEEEAAAASEEAQEQ